MTRRLCSLFAAAAIILQANAETPVMGSDKDLDREVAVFVASNIKLAVDNALSDLIATGVRCDTAAVRRMVIEQLALPYDAAAHRRANEAIDAAMSARAVAESAQFLAAAAARPRATVTDSGLVFEVIEEGTGATPASADTVTIRYRGILPDGTVFDNINPDEEPMTASVSDLAPGIAEGLLRMKTGGQYRLTVPSDLAYGTAGIPGVIPPDCALQFDITLLEIK